MTVDEAYKLGISLQSRRWYAPLNYQCILVIRWGAWENLMYL